MTDSIDLSKFKACSCGTTVDHLETVDVRYKYTWIGWFFWSMGTTAVPKQINFTCTTCNLQFESKKDRELIKHFTFYKKN